MESEKKTSKIVVFDLDETLGYFTELGILWDALISCKNNQKLNEHISVDFTITPELFNEILDLYPEFLRPNINSILNYLKYKKQMGICSGVMIYTNNKGPSEWSRYIINYFQNKIGYKLFDQIIGAFKKNGKIIEMNRTTSKKTIYDFISCTGIDPDTEICYIDDSVHEMMVVENVYYIKMISYKHFISYEELVERIVKSNVINKILKENSITQMQIIDDFKKWLLFYIKKINYVFINEKKDMTNDEKEISKKTMLLLQTFFDKEWRNKNNKKNSLKIKINPATINDNNKSHKISNLPSPVIQKNKTLKIRDK